MTLLESKNADEICDSQCVNQQNCPNIWSLVQFRSFKAVSKKKAPNEFNNIALPRIKQISSNYAKMHLEVGGELASKGRFYWAGLAAIAAKQVYCGVLAMQDYASRFGSSVLYYGGKLDRAMGMPQNNRIAHLENNSLSTTDIDYVREKILKGNLWLFLDIYPTHLYYKEMPKSFFSCLKTRDANKYHADVLRDLKKIPYISALPEIKNFRYDTYFLEAGFKFIEQYEQSTDLPLKDRQELQLKSLLLIAQHEQKIVLQECFYAPNGKLDQKLKQILDKQKKLENKNRIELNLLRIISDVQGRRAVLTNSCQIPKSVTSLSKKEQENFYEDMREGENLYDYEHRMFFINRIAKDYHYVMRYYGSSMDGYLKLLSKESIGEWVISN